MNAVNNARLYRCIACAALYVMLTACTGTPQLDRLNAEPASVPVRADVAGVPFYPQEDLYCGPAALAMVLTWTGQPVTQDDVARQVFTPGREGTLRSDMVGAARRDGRLAVPIDNLSALLGEIAAGHPVVVFQNLGLSFYEQWHYAVAIGYDLDKQEIYLHSGSDEYHVTALSTFERTWKRGDYWALVVLPPDRLPATARLEPVLGAAAGLERADRPDAAALAYRAIAARWTDDDASLIGLANTMYAQHDLAAAEAALRKAIRRQPASAPAWNNLAVILNERGKNAAALDAAQRAVSLDGGRTQTYIETLSEIGG